MELNFFFNNQLCYIKIAAFSSKQIYKAHESIVHHGFQMATVKPQNALNNKLHCAL